MPMFKWVGVGPNGETMRGEMEAMTRQAVITRLRTQRINPSPEKIKEKGKGFDREISLPSFGSPVKQHDIVIFTRQFATMINAGLPLVQCLDILAEQQQNAFFKDVLRQVRQNVEEGATLHAALEKHPKVFDGLYSHMVEAGETGGVLDLILQRLATLIEKVVKLKRSIVSASIYPAAVILVAIAAVAVIMVVVIPQFLPLL